MRHITATHFYNLAKCPARVYLDIHGDHGKKLPFSEFMQDKVDEGVRHEAEIIAGMPDAVSIDYHRDDEGFLKTLAAMKEGAKVIFQGVLLDGNHVGRPDLLIRIEGGSKFGAYEYYAVDIKSGHSAKPEYQMQVAFYSHLLGIVQEKEPIVAGLILWDGSQKEITLSKLKKEFDLAYEHIHKIHSGEKQQPHFCSMCKECGWRNECLAEMESTGDISLVSGLGREHKTAFFEMGITHLKGLAQAAKGPDGMTDASFQEFKRQAESLVSHQPIVFGKAVLPTDKKLLYFDIEGETALGVDYLLGVYTVEGGVGRYHGFFADKPSDEEKMWKEFLVWIDAQEDICIVHYHHYEKTVLKRLRAKYGCPDKTYKKLTKGMVDLFSVIKKTVVFPTYSYSVKDAAKAVGFTWRSSKAGGAQSIFWYDEWLKKGDVSTKQAILDYNEDDCRAMERLVLWLRENA